MPITIVQNTGLKAAAATSISFAFAANVTAGNAIIVVANGASTWAANPVSDSLANAYATAVTILNATNVLEAGIFFALNIAGGADTITVNTGVAPISAAALEVSGLLTAAALDKTASTDGTTAGLAPDSGTTAATAQANELVVAVFGDNTGLNPESITDPAGYTRIYQQTNGATYDAGGAVQKVVAAVGTQDATWTTGDNVNWVGCIATFKAAAAVAPNANRVRVQKSRWTRRWAPGGPPGFPYRRPQHLP